jgi:ethanolamine utilization protein EutP (predicted NTPase)
LSIAIDRTEIVVLSKTDMATDDEVEEKRAALKKISGKDVIVMSLFKDETVKAFGDTLINDIKKIKG